MGPLLAGLSGFGWAMLPPFVSIFVLWLILLRPHQWPQSASEWLSASAVAAVLAQVLSQLVLVAALFAIGRGIGGVMGTLPLLDPLLTVALSFLALPLMRLGWNPDQAIAEGVTIDDMIHAANLPTPPQAKAADPAATVAGLLSLADAAPPEAALLQVHQAFETGVGPAIAQSLAAALTEAPPERHAALREAVVVLATDPAIMAAASAPGALRAAFAATGQDLRLLRLLVPRAVALARAMPDRCDQFPDAATLTALANSGLEPAMAQELTVLANLLRTGGAASKPAQAA
ncbi:hypothetical protein LHP98_17375 [Rhodobacter sp. Har01]|uniref:hypothetical protein n=1 Tax=Rhodobacter sp. Har01 TaxID=2883999 RepID=UPI001D05F40C|nr:hypothetical protein [Rhodobacter sp. Har01]MCB6179896.1 hypothetical protein [Rhodobacter sp. Har01]